MGKFQAGGGQSACTACPANSISTSSSTVQSQCVCDTGFIGPGGGPCKLDTPLLDQEEFAPTDIIIQIVLGLPMSVDDFTPDKQTSFSQAIANAANVALSKVKIVNIEAVSARRRRWLLAESIRISVEVAAQDDRTAQAVSSNLAPDMINDQLQQAGLPQAEILEAASVQLPVTLAPPAPVSLDPKHKNTDYVVIIGASIGAVAPVALMCLVYRALSRHKQKRKHALDLELCLPLESGEEGRMMQADMIVPNEVIGNEELSVPNDVIGNEEYSDSVGGRLASAHYFREALESGHSSGVILQVDCDRRRSGDSGDLQISSAPDSGGARDTDILDTRDVEISFHNVERGPLVISNQLVVRINMWEGTFFNSDSPVCDLRNSGDSGDLQICSAPDSGGAPDTQAEDPSQTNLEIRSKYVIQLNPADSRLQNSQLSPDSWNPEPCEPY